jgi:ABC-type Fe3+-hydroxamate transport system substrate-binding protein
MKITRILSIVALAAVTMVSLAACSSDAKVVSDNLSKEADNFKVPRRVVLYNGFTDQYIQEIQGFCSLQPSSLTIAVVCKVDGSYVKHSWLVGDNTTVFSEQLTGVNVSASFYKVIFKPSVIIPAIELR